jgi:Fic family protein
MRVQARRRGRQTYYYLTYSYREEGRVRKVERYLGRAPPKDIEAIENELRRSLFAHRWESALNRARDEYLANLGSMPPIIREKELDTFSTRFTYDSNRIEGSSLTFRETASLLGDGITPGSRPLSDVLETLAHHRVFLEALRSTSRLDLEALLKWHGELFRLTKPWLAGKVREYRVEISGSAFEPPPPIELDFLLQEFFWWLRTSWRTLHPVVLAALVHLKLVTIHPFGDGNGRVTRIAMNYVLYRKRFPMIDIPFVRRAGYYRALEKAQVKRDDGLFVRWFLRRYLEENSRPKKAPNRKS